MKNNKKLSNILLTDEDFNLVNSLRNGGTSFGIPTLSEDIFNDQMAYNLESFFEENGFKVDIFNVEYMGFLTGQVDIKCSEINSILPIINKFIKKYN